MGLNENVTSLLSCHVSLNCNEHIPLEAAPGVSCDKNGDQAIPAHCHRGQ